MIFALSGLWAAACLLVVLTKFRQIKHAGFTDLRDWDIHNIHQAGQRKYPSDNCWLVTSLMLWYSDWIKKMNKILHKSDNSTFLFRLDKRSNWIILEYLNNCVGQVLNTKFYEYFGINLWISEFYRVNKNSVGGFETGQQQILFWFLTTPTIWEQIIGFQEFSNSWYILHSTF